MKNVLIVGYGEIGKSIHGLYSRIGQKLKVLFGLSEQCVVYFEDLKCDNLPEDIPEIDIMHVCIPYSEDFVKYVVSFCKDFKPKLVIVNSTVDIGTIRKISEKIKIPIGHSPVMGKHPKLTESMLTFKKIVGPIDELSGKLIKKHFESLGCSVVLFKSPEESELAKLNCTSHYGWNILYVKHLHQFCVKHNVDFENVYTESTKIYNEGYKKMGMSHFTKPILKYVPGPISGHCLIPNFVILKNGGWKIAEIALSLDEKPLKKTQEKRKTKECLGARKR